MSQTTLGRRPTTGTNHPFGRLSAVICRLSLLLPLTPATALAEEQQKGMPQLDFANPLTISQLVWLVVIFAVLYGLLSAWALPRVGRVIDDRAGRIAADLDTARAAKAQADAAAAEAREASRRAHAEGQLRINQAIEAAKQSAAAQAAVLNEALEQNLARSEQAIATARQQAMTGLRGVATTVAATMVARLAGRPADLAAIDAAVGGELARRAA